MVRRNQDNDRGSEQELGLLRDTRPGAGEPTGEAPGGGPDLAGQRKAVPGAGGEPAGSGLAARSRRPDPLPQSGVGTTRRLHDGGIAGAALHGIPVPRRFASDLQTLANLLTGPGGEIRGYETIFRRKDGRPIHFLVNAKAVRDAEGRVTGAYGTSTDITERRRMEATEADRTGRIIRFQEALLQLAKREMENLPNSLAAIARTAARALPVDRVSVWRFGPDRSELVCEILHDEVPAARRDRTGSSSASSRLTSRRWRSSAPSPRPTCGPIREPGTSWRSISRDWGSERAWMFRSGGTSGWRGSSASSTWAAGAPGTRRRSTSPCPSPTRWRSSWRRTSGAGRRTSSGPSSGPSNRVPAW